MASIELGSAQATADVLCNTTITFGAHWCCPCKTSRPPLEDLDKEMNSRAGGVKTGICFECELGDAIQTYHDVHTLPTQIRFANGKETKRKGPT